MNIKPILTVSRFLLIIFSWIGCNQNNNSSNSKTGIDSTVNKNLDAVFNNYWEQHLKLFPLDATFSVITGTTTNSRMIRPNLSAIP